MSAVTEPRYGWTDFEQDESTDVLPDKLVLTITDEGEEMAVIVHRRVFAGKYEEQLMDTKREQAQRIVDALNAREEARA